MKWREIITDYFTFTRRESIGIIVTLIIIIILSFPRPLFNAKDSIKLSTPDTAWITALKKLETKDSTIHARYYDEGEIHNYQYEPSGTNHHNALAGELFYFDPNTLSKEGWQKLGLRGKTINIIENYIGKGGKFRKPEDLRKVYGLRSTEYERLVPFIKIQTGLEKKSDENFIVKNERLEKSIPFLPNPRTLLIDINSADTSAFILLPGIGSKLAARIVNFRDKLGGFYSIEQVQETFGLPDSTFQKIKKNLVLNTSTIKKLNVNSATTDELKSHPYIKWNIANTLISYRNEHGNFSAIEDIKKVMTINEDIYKKIAPYLVIQ